MSDLNAVAEFRAFPKTWGAEYVAAGEVRFSLWAPGQDKVLLRLNGEDTEMTRSDDGWFELLATGVAPGAEYNYVLADGMVVPDPASRAQKKDVNGPSLVIDPTSYDWKDQDWSGRPWEETVVYELHVGTFTPEGTFRSAIDRLPYLVDLGITMIEVMPVSQFGGDRGWGYDGVLLYAPHSAYGPPEDFKAFVDAAHGHGLSVVLDIVLNHFGPEGNYLPVLAPDFFHKERQTPWGAAIAYDVDAARRYISEAPLYWLEEYHLDGLRFDAIDQIEDVSDKHVLIEIAERIRAEITDRPIHLTTEDSRNVIFLHPREKDGSVPLFTGEWNDDLHNAAHVFATGETHAYYQDFAKEPERLVARILTEGFAYQGEVSPQTGTKRGVDSIGQPPVAFVDFIQNHDQVGNRAQGERLISLAGADRTKALLASLLLSPHIPLMFMGEEYGETRPFLFFTDFHGDLAKAVREGRAKEFEGHAGHEGEEVPDPNAKKTFELSKLDWKKSGSPEGSEWLEFTKTLLALRRDLVVPMLASAPGGTGRIIDTGEGYYAVAWALPRGHLSIAVNIGSGSYRMIPTSTYRIQFRNGMTFDRAAKLAPYIKRLGISHLYASPVFTATSGSTHGYDVTDANEIDPVIGGREGFDRMVAALKSQGLGLILDIVPNHMAASLENAWWRDVVENGERSRYARHFDIDWSRRLTLPFLGDSFDRVLEAGDIAVKADPGTGKPALAYYETFYPLDPETYAGREADVLKLTDKAAIAELHERQPYRLMSWRDAPRDLSYRRFFEITGLAGVRVEDAQVFDDTHRLILELVRSGVVDGLRVDHVDGLADPKAYLERLRQEAGPDCYITVEKILGEGEDIASDWPISGTTGYEFIAALSDVLVDGDRIDDLHAAYSKVAGAKPDMEAELRSAKLLMADNNFAGEVASLVKLARAIHDQLGEGPALAEADIRTSLRELFVAFPVYRTYGTAGGMPPEGRQMLQKVIDQIKRMPGNAQLKALPFLKTVIDGDVPDEVSAAAATFRTRFQQLTGPLMAKSVEDTLFFRHHALIALNEVGAEPLPRVFSLERFHEEMRSRLERQPDGLSGTSTHDTKRGEDARARLYTISEAPSVWADAVDRWRRMNREAVKQLPDGPAPEPALEWMLYQALAGVWPSELNPDDEQGLHELTERFKAFAEKAMREAKLRSSWNDVNEDYEGAVIAYIEAMLAPQNQDFLQDFSASLRPFARAGHVNSLTQTLVKLTAPGVPDIYQGSEGCDLSLVDPDNRREPDFDELQRQLSGDASLNSLDEDEWRSGRLKQHVIAQVLNLRKKLPDLFRRGSYIPLKADGKRSDNIIAYARHGDGKALVVVAPRLVLEALRDVSRPHSSEWAETIIALPKELAGRRYQDVFSGRSFDFADQIAVNWAFAGHPFAVLKPSDKRFLIRNPSLCRNPTRRRWPSRYDFSSSPTTPATRAPTCASRISHGLSGARPDMPMPLSPSARPAAPPMAMPSDIPIDRASDSTMAFFREGYDFISNRCDRFGSDIFQARIMLRNVIYMRGPQAARLLYGEKGLTRRGSMPQTVLRLLQDKGSVQQLDDGQHLHRKTLFIRMLMQPRSSASLVAGFREEWDNHFRSFPPHSRIVLIDAANRILTIAVCRWAGVPLPPTEVDAMTKALAGMVENAGHVRPATFGALFRRSNIERHLRTVIQEVRSGRLAAPKDAPISMIADHIDFDGKPLSLSTAAVELLNVLRPVVAIGRFITFGAMALHQHPEWKHRFEAGDDGLIDAFVEEVSSHSSSEMSSMDENVAWWAALLTRMSMPPSSDTARSMIDRQSIDMNPVDNKGLAVVTGASTGIGYELAKCAAQAGYDLVIAANEPRIQEAAGMLKEYGRQVEAMQVDLAEPDGVRRFCAAVESLGRPVELLLANAGQGLGHGFLDQDLEAAQRVVDTNVTGTLALVHHIGNSMRRQGRGRILFTGSIAGFMPGTFQAVYNATKAFINSFSFALREELKDTGVTVTCLMPGPTDTDFFERADLMDTAVGQGKKDDPAYVAKIGFDAMMEGDGDVVAGWKNKVMSAVANVTPAGMLAGQHRKMAEPGSGKH
eukprot:g7618.t1